MWVGFLDGFHKPDDQNIFLLGTEEGVIYLASNEFSTEYLMEYTGHSTPINAIMWNPFHPSVFLSCASEYNVNVWHKAGKVQFYEQKTLVFNQEIHFYSASNRYFLPKGSFPTTNDV